MQEKLKTFEAFDDEPPKEDRQKRVYVSNITATKLSELDLDKELLQQYKNAMQLADEAEFDVSIPLSQKAQLLNSIKGIISEITRIQTELYSAERLKLFESTIINVLKGFPEINKAFLDAYEAALNE